MSYCSNSRIHMYKFKKQKSWHKQNERTRLVSSAVNGRDVWIRLEQRAFFSLFFYPVLPFNGPSIKWQCVSLFQQFVLGAGQIVVSYNKNARDPIVFSATLLYMYIRLYRRDSSFLRRRDSFYITHFFFTAERVIRGSGNQFSNSTTVVYCFFHCATSAEPKNLRFPTFTHKKGDCVPGWVVVCCAFSYLGKVSWRFWRSLKVNHNKVWWSYRDVSWRFISYGGRLVH